MNDGNVQTIEQVRQFMGGSEAIKFRVLSVGEKYRWIEEVLIRFRYDSLKRDEKGVIRRYIERITGYSRAQVSRLITEYKRRGRIKQVPYRRYRFSRKYTPAEVILLAETDELHGWLSGPATKKIMEREYEVYGHTAFKNISLISVAHLYNLRRGNTYRNITRRLTKTKPALSQIGERAKPDPRGQPGYIRIDTVHQGDMNGSKGVYHINAVDQVTQWEIVNHIVASLLNKLLINFTKSIPRHSNDNGLVETKNGSVVRKNLGYAHIPQACAELLNGYHKDYLNPYINFHRSCFFPVSVIDHRGKIKKTYLYEEVMTPYERLKSVPKAESYLRSGVTLGKLGTIVNQMSDNQFVERFAMLGSELENEDREGLSS
ncbi:MAG: integrase [Chloroflexota bacterium]|nr:integrase [Chloroflexota bacterium]